MHMSDYMSLSETVELHIKWQLRNKVGIRLAFHINMLYQIL